MAALVNARHRHAAQRRVMGGRQARNTAAAHHHVIWVARSSHQVVSSAIGRPPAGKSSTGGLPMGNGAESRFTYHYFPPGYGAQVSSPQTTEIRPMFIDITNRKEFGEPLVRFFVVTCER